MNSAAPECIILSSDSEDDKKSKQNFLHHKSSSKVSNFAETSTNIKSDPDSKNPLIRQKISVNKDTVTVKLVTQFRNNFSGSDTPEKGRQNTISKISKALPCNKKRVQLKRPNESSANKFMFGSGQSPIKRKFHQKDSDYSSSDAEIIEMKTSKISDYRPPETVRQCFPLVQLGKSSTGIPFKKDGKANLMASVISPKPNINTGLINPKPYLNTGLINLKPNLSTGLINPKPNLNAGLINPKPNLNAGLINPKPNLNADLMMPSLQQNSNADLTKSNISLNADMMKSKPMSLADMPDVKHLIDLYEKYAKDEDDRLVAKLFQKKMKKLPINSLSEYEDVYQSYVLSIRRKIANNPSKTNLHLREFVDEIKKCKKSEPLTVAPVAASFNEPKPSTSKEIDCSNSTSSFSPDDKIVLLEKKMQILNRKIIELQKKDISLAEMDEDSPYILIEKYEKKYMQLLACYSKLTDVGTTRSVDKPYKFRGSRYPEFNSAVGKLVRRLKPDLPDYSDFYGLASKCNKKYVYRLSDCDVKYLARNTLDQVVEEIKKRRGYDFNMGLDQWLELNMEQVAPDPAKTDENLKAQLKRNSVMARERTEEIIKHYVEKQEEFEKTFPEQHKKLMEHGEQDDNEEEDEEEDDEEASDFELIDEEISKEISNQPDNDSTLNNDINTGSESLPSIDSFNETDSESSDKTDDENETDLDEISPSFDLTTYPVKQPPPTDGVSSLKIVSVEGAGNLFYSCEDSPDKNYIFKSSKVETDDSEIVVLD